MEFVTNRAYYSVILSRNDVTKRKKLKEKFFTYEGALFPLPYPLASKGLSMRQPKLNRRLRRREPSSNIYVYE